MKLLLVIGACVLGGALAAESNFDQVVREEGGESPPSPFRNLPPYIQEMIKQIQPGERPEVSSWNPDSENPVWDYHLLYND